jgi:hypothetical protein
VPEHTHSKNLYHVWVVKHTQLEVRHLASSFPRPHRDKLLTNSEAIMSLITPLFDATNASKNLTERPRKTSIKEPVLLMYHLRFSKSSIATKQTSLMRS